jgi:hypothetical protein
MTIRYGNIRKPVKTPKREVEFDGCWHKVKSNKIEIPDLKTLPRFEALMWLCRNTYGRGYSRPNALAGLAGAISVSAQA